VKKIVSTVQDNIKMFPAGCHNTGKYWLLLIYLSICQEDILNVNINYLQKEKLCVIHCHHSVLPNSWKLSILIVQYIQFKITTQLPLPTCQVRAHTHTHTQSIQLKYVEIHFVDLENSCTDYLRMKLS